MTALLLTCQNLDRGTLVGVAGELDTTTTGQLATYLEGRHPDSSLPLVLDLAAVTFMDSSGLHLLIDLHHRQDTHGGRLYLAAPHERVLRVLEITGTDRLLLIHPSLRTALTAANLALSPA
ncbi:STAS domain-containing protein [Nonomuraea endophytica]|uniref:Anti-sigma factor antagonist n=1 Tax=Nonomuraea endophytica TaxID=714136 RepID=A0A7W8ABQ4_9ACTN|nr:STAS domain-containing protein [Nonomuraea endophytica]MBB5082265.1 anti-anti-sigma factor [Nonomuraea endophytica]